VWDVTAEKIRQGRLKMKLFRLLGIALFLALTGCSANRPLTLSVSQQAEIVRIDFALQLATDHEFARAEGVIQEIIHAKDFDRLPSTEQYRALTVAAKLAVNLKHPKLEFESRVRLVALPEATAQDRALRVDAAYRLQDTGEIIIGLTDLAKKNPERLDKSAEPFIIYWIGEGKRKLPHSATLPLLQALYAAHWKVEWNQEPSGFWRDLVLLLLEQHRLAEAVDVSTHITEEYAVISMRADRRFDAVVAAAPAHFDVDAAFKHNLQAFQSAAQQAPQSLAPQQAVADLLLEQQHDAASLAVADGMLAEIRSNSDPKQWYEDYAEQYVWILDNRSRALRRLGRWDEAVDQLKEASFVLNKSGENVSQVINLGELYCDLGRPIEAREALKRLGVKISAYGLMQEASVRLDAAVQLDDTEQTAKWLGFIRDHRVDAPRTYQSALLLVNDSDTAAMWLIERLQDPDLRSTTLLSIQDYAVSALTPRQAELRKRTRALIARPDVQVEIQKVGRIEKYDLEEIGH
jgi:tetratricopeptide (TPR) repeat protein